MGTAPITLVLGLGNLLLGDEGAGVHAARRLSEQGGLPEDVRVLDVGTAVLDVLDDLETAGRVVVVDAMAGGGPPGTIYRVPLEGCRSPSHLGSMHGFDIRRVLALTRRVEPPEAVVLGIEPGFMGWSLDLSPPVAEAFPHLVEAVRREVAPQACSRAARSAAS